MYQHKSGKQRLAAQAGMLGTLVFVGVFTLEGLLRPGYSPVSMFVSELSLGPRGWIQIANFMVSGMLLLIFARGLAAEFPSGNASTWGPRLMTLFALFVLLSGPLVMDPASTPRSDWSWHGLAHSMLGSLIFLTMPIICFVFWPRFKADPEWQSLARWTLAAGLVTVVGFILMSLIAVPPAPPNALNPYAGLIQRMALIPFLAWLFSLAYALDKRANR